MPAACTRKLLGESWSMPASTNRRALRAMTAAGLFASVPGPKGGYRLARSAEAISLLDIVLAVEGDRPAFRCSEIRRCGPTASPPSAYGATCAIHAAMLAAERTWRGSLASTSLADITRRIGRSLRAEVRAKAQAWLGANVRA